jgi:hypothetical protein
VTPRFGVAIIRRAHLIAAGVARSSGGHGLVTTITQ